MSTGFEFSRKPTIVVCGKNYLCDFSDSSMMRGVAYGWPRIIQAAEEMRQSYAQMLAGIGRGEESKDYVEQTLQKNDMLVKVCREFIEGTLGVSEYQEIFAGRNENSSEHMELCAYIYGKIMDGRQQMLEQYMDPEMLKGDQTDERTADADPADAGTAGEDRRASGSDRLAVVDAVCGESPCGSPALDREA